MNSSLGVKFSSGSDEKCIVCIKGKQTRAPFKDTGTRANGLLDLVHSDVMGPLKSRSFSGARFLVTFVDDFSRKVFVVPIKHKSDVFGEFVKFKNFVENQCSTKIKVLRTDNGTEYTGTAFKSFLENNGILHQKTAAYTPEQNGVAERINRTLIERVRCMLLDSGLPNKFWAEAVVTAAFLVNRVPCRDNDCSPEEIWSRRKPDLSNLRVFGCKAMVHVPKEKRTKLDAKSVKCILLGYSTESKAYRLFHPLTQKIITSRDVIFMESDSKVTSDDNNNINTFVSTLVDLSEDEDNSIGNSREEVLKELPNLRSKADLHAVSSNHNTSDLSNYSDYDDADDRTFIPDEDVSITENDEIIRRSERIMNLPKPDYNFVATDLNCNDPGSPKEALSSYDAKLWRNAMQEEFDSLLLNETWTLTELPPGKKAINSKWVFKTKFDTEGKPVRRKARLVVKGFSQQKGIDYTETFAPVVRYTSIRYLLALAVKHDLIIHQMDAVTAFLNAELKEDIYMTQPSCFEDGSDRVCKLRKSLYGLKQSSRMWNEKLNHVLISMNLKLSDVDQCVYFQYSGEQMLFIAIYVDDVLIFSNSLDLVKNLKDELSKNFRMKDMGEATSVLGIRIQRSKSFLKIDQSQYISDILRRFNMDDCNPISTPIDLNQKLSSDMCPKDDNEKRQMKNVPYMQAIGSLLFAAEITRPDICYAVNLLSRFGTNPGKAHWSAVKRVMRYLKGTIDKGIVYQKEACDMSGFCDADWAGDMDARRSTTGYVFKFQSGAISWATKRQRTVALSSTEAEVMSIVAAIQESVWLKRLEAELFPDVQKPIILYCDNKSAIYIVSNNSYSSRTKHVDIKAKFIREKLERSEVKLEYLPTDQMLADILTKGVVAAKQIYFSNHLGLK